MTSGPRRYRPVVFTAARTVALPHGYTLLIWATTMVMVGKHGLPDVLAVFSMLLGACVAYILAGALGSMAPKPTEAPNAENPNAAAPTDGPHPGAQPASSASGGQGKPWQPRLVRQPYIVATANFVTLSAATGVSVLAANLIAMPHIGWLVVGVVGTAIYLLGIAIQSRLVDHILVDADDEATV